MASSKNSPGIHDRAPGVPRQRCIHLLKGGNRRCTRGATASSKLCRIHLGEVQRGLPTPAETTRRNITRAVTGAFRGNATQFVLTQQAADALRKLGIEPGKTDPKLVLLDSVRSAWQQAQVWEGMLASIPPEDWAHVGRVPLPGQMATAKGARIETIQRFLTEATKTAARSSKLAIDAGIEERLVRLAEEQSALIADTVRAGLIAGIASLHLAPQAEAAMMELAIGRAAHHLRALAAGAGGGEIIDGIAQQVMDAQPQGESQ